MKRYKFLLAIRLTHKMISCFAVKEWHDQWPADACIESYRIIFGPHDNNVRVEMKTEKKKKNKRLNQNQSINEHS